MELCTKAAGRAASDRLRGQPHRHIAASNECAVVGRPVRHAVLCLVPGMDLRLHPCRVAPAEGPEKCRPNRPTHRRVFMQPRPGSLACPPRTPPRATPALGPHAQHAHSPVSPPAPLVVARSPPPTAAPLPPGPAGVAAEATRARPVLAWVHGPSRRVLHAPPPVAPTSAAWRAAVRRAPDPRPARPGAGPAQARRRGGGPR